MNYSLNHLGQPLGPLLVDWKAPPWPSHETMKGQYCSLEKLDPDRHSEALFAANQLDHQGSNWTYLPYGPFESLGDYRCWIEKDCLGREPLFFAIIDSSTNRAVGVASYLDIKPTSGSIEVGHLNFSPELQKTRAATEAMYLMMSHAFELGYRRYQWKCNALNAPSRAAALRLGLSFEGVFRNATVSKGRSRDSAWYAAIDSEWPALKSAFQTWLQPTNFDNAGKQRISLFELTGPVLKQRESS